MNIYPPMKIFNSNKKRRYFKLSVLIIFFALVNLLASAYRIPDETRNFSGRSPVLIESESLPVATPVPNKLEKRSGSTPGISVLVIETKDDGSLNKIKLQYKSFQPQNYHPVRERTFLTSKYSTDI